MMNRLLYARTTVLALVLTSVSACDGNGISFAGVPKNAAETEIQRLIDSVGFECSQNPGIIRFVFDPYPPEGSEPHDYKAWEVTNFGFRVEEREISASEKLNGTTFSGVVVFDENMSWRQSGRLYATVPGPTQFIVRAEKWYPWKNITSGDPDRGYGHYIKQVNGKWSYKAHADYEFRPLAGITYAGARLKPLMDDCDF